MKPQVKYGLLVGIASFIIFIVMNAVDADRGSILYYMSMFILTFGIYFTLKDTRDSVGSITFGKGLGLGVLCSLVAGSSDGLGRYIYCKVFFHPYITNLRTLSLDTIESSNPAHYNAEQMAMVKKLLPYIVSPGSLAIIDIIGTVFTGFLLALVISAILRKDNQQTSMPGF
jgi:hypothetical protein